MKKRTLTYIILSVIITTQSSSAFAIDDHKNATFSQFFKKHSHWTSTAIEDRIRIASSEFLDKPYVLGSLGEGQQGEFDQHPLYRDDAFDCETFVTTVLALSHSHSFAEFKIKMNQIRYQDGQVSYVKRNHFTSTDYNMNALHLGLIHDISDQIHNHSGESISLIAETTHNKPRWYEHKKLSDLWFNRPLSTEQKAVRLAELHKLAQHVKPEKAVQTYIPISALFDENERPINDIWAQFPEVALIEIVRPQWHIADKIGTDILVSHMGLLIRRDGQYTFREASQNLGKVVDISLQDYLKGYLHHPTIKGISIFTIQP